MRHAQCHQHDARPAPLAEYPLAAGREFYATADSAQQRVISATFDGLNTYLGNYLGEFVGELSFNAFFVLSGWVLLRTRPSSRWLAAVGLLTGILGWIGMFRNLTPAVAPVAAVNNYLLPLWMIVLGVILFRHRAPAPVSVAGVARPS